MKEYFDALWLFFQVQRTRILIGKLRGFDPKSAAHHDINAMVNKINEENHASEQIIMLSSQQTVNLLSQTSWPLLECNVATNVSDYDNVLLMPA